MIVRAIKNRLGHWLIHWGVLLIQPPRQTIYDNRRALARQAQLRLP